AALHALSAARQRWAETSVNRRLALLRQIKDALAGIAPAWVACGPARLVGGAPALGGNLSEPSSGAPAPDQGCPG
ncbi:hypothetical protein CJP33_26890, partial [Klebsiella pneumoniae]